MMCVQRACGLSLPHACWPVQLWDETKFVQTKGVRPSHEFCCLSCIQSGALGAVISLQGSSGRREWERLFWETCNRGRVV